MAPSADSYVATCESCIRLCRDRGAAQKSEQSFNTAAEDESSGLGGESFRSLFMVQPRMVMHSMPVPTASALALKDHTLPSIQEEILPKQPTLESPMLGCNLEEEVWSFNSIASRDNINLDPSWQRFLKNFDASEFTEDRREENPHAAEGRPSIPRQRSTSNEITPVDTDAVEAAMYNAVRDVAMASAGEIVIEHSNNELKHAGSLVARRKDAGQKKEKTKGGRLTPFSRKTVPVTEIDDGQDTPFGRLSAPFRFSVLPAHEDVPTDEVAARGPLRGREARDLPEEEQKTDGDERDSSSSGSSFRNRLRWLAAQPSSSYKSSRRKKTSLPNLGDELDKGRTDAIRKVAGVHDGSKKRRSKSERWIRC